MATLILLNKPFNVLCQFTDRQGRKTLADFVDVDGAYPAGRLDYDSEGLVLLTDDGTLQNRISAPGHKTMKTYWVQVEGEISPAALEALRQGVSLKDGPSRPAIAEPMATPDVWARIPPVRERLSVPTSWLSLSITEGRNRQVRRMTAAVGHPTLRLIRYRIGDWTLDGLAPGECRMLTLHMPAPKRPKAARGRRRQTPHPTGKHK